MDTISFKTYDEIPVPVKEYVLTVSGVKSIYELDMFTINVFLKEMNSYYNSLPEFEYDEVSL